MKCPRMRRRNLGEGGGNTRRRAGVGRDRRRDGGGEKRARCLPSSLPLASGVFKKLEQIMS